LRANATHFPSGEVADIGVRGNPSISREQPTAAKTATNAKAASDFLSSIEHPSYPY
jgi:hypothetical protein